MTLVGKISCALLFLQADASVDDVTLNCINHFNGGRIPMMSQYSL